MSQAPRRTALLLAGAMLAACGGDDATGPYVPSEDSAAPPDVSQVASEASNDALSDASAPESADMAEPVEASDVQTMESDAQGDRATSDMAITDVVADPSSDGAEAGLSQGDADAGLATTKICALACATTDDCRGDASRSKQVCDPESHRCVNCVDDLPCIAAASLWTRSCAVDGDCAPSFGDYCVDVGGFGLCAFDQAKIGTQSCQGNDSTHTIQKHGDAGTLGVCARLANTCDRKRGRCEAPCAPCDASAGPCTNVCTAARGGKTCNVATQHCECASDDDCATPFGHCNLRTAQCECASVTDCAPDGGSALVCQ